VYQRSVCLRYLIKTDNNWYSLKALAKFGQCGIERPLELCFEDGRMMRALNASRNVCQGSPEMSDVRGTRILGSG
jgi:hypothetical protein